MEARSVLHKAKLSFGLFFWFISILENVWCDEQTHKMQIFFWRSAFEQIMSFECGLRYPSVCCPPQQRIYKVARAKWKDACAFWTDRKDLEAENSPEEISCVAWKDCYSSWLKYGWIRNCTSFKNESRDWVSVRIASVQNERSYGGCAELRSLFPVQVCTL